MFFRKKRQPQGVELMREFAYPSFVRLEGGIVKSYWDVEEPDTWEECRVYGRALYFEYLKCVKEGGEFLAKVAVAQGEMTLTVYHFWEVNSWLTRECVETPGVVQHYKDWANC